MNPNDQNKNQKDSLQGVRDQVALLSFIENLIKEKNDPQINEKNIDQVKMVLLRQLNEMIDTHLISMLDEGSQRELDQLLDKNIPNKELEDFFKSKIPNLDVEIANVLLNFRAAYLYPLTQKKEN